MGVTTVRTLRKSPSGWFLEGTQDFDVLIWSEATREWIPGPVIAAFPPGNNPGDLFIWDGVQWTIGPGGGGPVVLAGDANGPSGSNEVNSLTGTAGGANVALLDMSSDPAEASFVVRQAAGGGYETVPVSTLTTLAGDANGPIGANEVNSLTGTAGGANVLLDDMSSDPVEFSFVLRSPAGGPYVTAPVSSVFRTEFDFILESRADLIAAVGAPVGGVFTLLSGSYALKLGFALNAGEGLLCPVGASVLMMGLGEAKVLSSDPGAGNPLLDIAANANCELITVNLTSTVTNSIGVRSAGNLKTIGCNLVASTGSGLAVSVTDGSWRDTGSTCRGGTGGAVNLSGGVHQAAQSLFVASGDAFIHSAGTSETTNCIVDAGARGLVLSGGANHHAGITVTAVSHGVEATNPAATQYDFAIIGGHVTSAARAVLINGLLIDVDFVELDLETTENAGTVFEVLASSTVQVNGGTWRSVPANRGSGLRINGAMPGGLLLNQVHGQDIGPGDASGHAFVVYTSGAVRRASIIGCDTAQSVLTAINWPAASIPTLGLSLVGNAWDDANPYVGFTHTDARVNAKANLFTFGLMPETAIVP